jgi:predicted transcriptional regulator
MVTKSRNIRSNHPLERLRHILESSGEDMLLSEEWAQRLNLSRPQLERYVHVMVQKGLLAEDTSDDEPRYRATEHGQRFLESYQRIQHLLLPERVDKAS